MRSKAVSRTRRTARQPRAVSGRRTALAFLPFPLRWTLVASIYLAPLLLAALLAVILYCAVTLPDPLSLTRNGHTPIVRILAHDGSELARRGAPYDYIPIAMLPRHVADAIVATEDRRFREHFGIDPSGLVRALYTNLRAGRLVQGGSTLTQQLAKNLFLSPERTWVRKLEELALALWLEVRLTKDDILELYLNRVYFGGGAYGIEAAAQRYFSKSAQRLTLVEAAILAGLVKAPSKYAPTASPGLARARGRLVLHQMAEAGLITADQRTRALHQRVVFASAKRHDETGAGYAVDFVLERLPPLVRSGVSELVVETTLDAGLQRRAQAIVEDQLAREGASLDAEQAALVALDADGAIRALVGGKDYAENGFNRAVKALRQPGSAFKPIVYLAALENGRTPDSTVYDLPVSIKGWAPRNDNGEYAGAIPMHQALARSLNSVAVRLLMEVGVGRVLETARRLGIKSELGKEASLALGTSEVSLLELTGAYDVFANGGRAVEPHVIERVRTGSGQVLYARRPGRSPQVVSPVHVAHMNSMLTEVIDAGTGRRAALPLHPAAGKTGTTQDFRDAWFIGYTAHLTVGVWVGNDMPRPMKRVVGGGLPAEIWRKVMLVALENRPPLPLASAVPEPARRASQPQDGGSSAISLSHPSERIGQGFIARALEAANVTLETPDPVNRAPGSPALSRSAQRPVSTRFPHRMSLGLAPGESPH